MIHRNPFDEQVKQQLEGYTPTVPGHIWDNINNKKKKKRPLFYFFNLNGKGLALFLLIMAIASGGSFWHFNSIATDNKGNKSIAAANTVITTINTGVSNTSINKLASRGFIVDKVSISTPEMAIRVGSYQPEMIIKAITSDQKQTKITHENNIKTKNHHLTESTNVESQTPINHAEKNNYSAANDNKSYDENSNNQLIKTTVSRNPISKKLIKHKSGDIETIVYDNNNIAGIVNDNQPLFRTQANDMSLLSSHFKLNPKLISINHPALTIPCPNNNTAVNKNYFDFYAAADYVLRQFKDTPNSQYLISRKESTSFSSAFSVGLRYNKVFSNGISVSAGLNFSQINEKFTYKLGNIIQNIFIINSVGDTIGSYQTLSTRYKTSYNSYKTLDIPLTLGYEINRGRWDLNFNTGFIVNIHSWNRGAVLNDALQPIAIGNKDSNSQYQFKSNIGIGGLGAISCYFKMNDHLKVLVEPYLRYNFSTINKEDISLKQKYHTSGIKLGFRLDL